MKLNKINKCVLGYGLPSRKPERIVWLRHRGSQRPCIYTFLPIARSKEVYGSGSPSILAYCTKSVSEMVDM